LSQNSKINLIHRRDGFSGAQASVDKVKQLEKAGKINLFTQYQLIQLKWR
jgi:thioredoxin reductase (NADPH)